MGSSCSFGFKRQGLDGPLVCGPAFTCTRGTVKSGLARGLFRGGPCSSDHPHCRFTRRFGCKSSARGIRPLPLECEDGGALFACRFERIPPGLSIQALNRGGCLLVIDAVNWARIEAETSQSFFELAYVAAAGSGRHVAIGRGRSAQNEDRTAGD